ncbi:MAG TPA: flagellar FliJ family protein [Acidobacteriaceae bacterium]|nr:flagellar FliJ family protein [Acidobacteriaceae bacterium]
MAFRFTLASVLGVRESLERLEELALARIQLEMARVRHEIEKTNADLAEAQRVREESMRKPIPAAQLQSMLHAADAAAERKAKLIESLVLLEKQRGEQMRAYQAARRGRQVLSDLREQHLEAWEQEQARTQQKVLDDIFASRNQRN